MQDHARKVEILAALRRKDVHKLAKLMAPKYGKEYALATAWRHCVATVNCELRCECCGVVPLDPISRESVSRRLLILDGGE
jgi:hypothetical protein